MYFFVSDPFLSGMLLPSLLDSQVEEAFAEPEECYQPRSNQHRSSSASRCRLHHQDMHRNSSALGREPASQRPVPAEDFRSQASRFRNVLRKDEGTKTFAGDFRSRNRESSRKSGCEVSFSKGQEHLQTSNSANAHSSTCPRHPLNLAIAHKSHKSFIGGKPEAGTRSIHRSSGSSSVSFSSDTLKSRKENQRLQDLKNLCNSNGNLKSSSNHCFKDGISTNGNVSRMRNHFQSRDVGSQHFQSQLRQDSNKQDKFNHSTPYEKHTNRGAKIGSEFPVHQDSMRKSENLERYAIPPAARPVRSKSNLSEFFRTKTNISSSREIEKEDHIYDTIDHHRGHKNAIDRIDQVLQSSKSVYDVRAFNYDIPKKALPLIKADENNYINNTSKRQNIPTKSLVLEKNRLSKSEVDLRLDPQQSDSDSSATYATIISNVLNRITDDENKDMQNRLRTLDIKEEKRRTPDIVKCSRHPQSKDSKQNVISRDHIVRSHLLGDSHTQYTGNSQSSSDLENTSTVIYIPSKYLNGQNVSSSSGNSSLKAFGSTPNIFKSIEETEEEIYSVVEDWHAKEEQDKKMKSLKEKDAPSENLKFSLGGGTLDPLRNCLSGSTSSQEDSCCNSQNSSGSHVSSTVHPTPPNVTFCSSADELCNLVSSDPSALVYVYKFSQANGKPEPSVFILSGYNSQIFYIILSFFEGLYFQENFI